MSSNFFLKIVQKETHVGGSFTVILKTVDCVNDDLINLSGLCRVHVRWDPDVRVGRRIAWRKQRYETFDLLQFLNRIYMNTYLIIWIQLILKNYLYVLLITFHGKLWCLFTENNLLCVGTVTIVQGYLISLLMHRSTLSMDSNSHFPNKVIRLLDNVHYTHLIRWIHHDSKQK